MASAPDPIDWKTKVARYISVIGHPFLTVPLFVIFILFQLEDTQKATLLSFLIIGGIFVPVAIRTYLGVRKGTITNLDVSDQAQRQGWFVITTILLFIVTLIIWLTNQHALLRLAITCAFLLLLIAQIVNTRVKASMHLAFHTFLGFLIFHFSWSAGLLFLLFAPLLAWSRLHLMRHVSKEIVVGISLGAIFGWIFLLFV